MYDINQVAQLTKIKDLMIIFRIKLVVNWLINS